MFISSTHTFTTAESHDFVSNGEEWGSVSLRGNGGSPVIIYLESRAAARAIASIINGDVEGLAERIEYVLDNANDMDVTFGDFALQIACDLTGKDVDAAYRARREAAE